MSSAPAQTGSLPATVKRRPACAIICAYNEARNLQPVVRVAVESGIFSTVLLVDDGSSDSTAQTALDAGAAVMKHAKNRGKAAAMRTGLGNTSAPIVCFLDADLLNITPDHLRSLVEPVATGEAEATLGVFSGGRLATTLAQSIAPNISGQRCLKRELLTEFNDWDSGYGIETAINEHLRRLGVRMTVVHFEGAGQVMKEEKRGLLAGFAARLGMYADICRTWVRVRTRIGPRRDAS